MNPYESSPDNIPTTDIYADVPLYGRYFPRPNDFQVDPQYVGSQSSDALQYWSSVMSLCTESVRIYPADEGGRDVFALGSVIVSQVISTRPKTAKLLKSTIRTPMETRSKLLRFPGMF